VRTDVTAGGWTLDRHTVGRWTVCARFADKTDNGRFVDNGVVDRRDVRLEETWLLLVVAMIRV
jgi:hypothetical protein